MTGLVQANNTYAQIELLVRRLTASASDAALPSTDIQQQVNTFYNNDFPYAIKLDQMRSVYTFYTEANRDRYPLDVNYNQGVRAPMYVDGIQGFFYKNRDEFYRMWPRWPTVFQVGPTTPPFIYQFTLPGPFLSEQVTLGGTDISGNPISIADDGNGGLWSQSPNPVVSVPPYAAVYPNPPPINADNIAGKSIPGMYNLNTRNPGLNNQVKLGTVNYVSGAFNFILPNPLLAGTTLRVHVSQYQTGRPYCLLFWNNEFTIRPIPKFTHRVEIEVYLTPVQFMSREDHPILNQWVQYIAYGVSMEILRQRQDMEGVQNLMEGFKRQEAMVLERQGVEEIDQRNRTVFSGTQRNLGWNNGWMQGWY